MQIVFYIGVFACFAFIGYIIWRGYYQRKVYFNDLITFCNHLMIEISFSKNTVQHIIQTYGQSFSLQFRNTLIAYQNLINNKCDITRESIQNIVWKGLKPGTKGPIADFFFELGRHGATEEMEKVQNKKVIFDKLFETASTSLKRDASIYLKVFILLGVAAVVLLI